MADEIKSEEGKEETRSDEDIANILHDKETKDADALAAEEKAAAEAKAKEAGDGEDKDGTADKKSEAKAPEEYEAFKMPEGMAVDEKRLEAFLPVAKDLNLTQDEAQKLVTMFADARTEAVSEAMAAWEKTQSDWRDAAKGDEEMGGTHWDATVVFAKTFLDKYGTPELNQALNDTGIGNHPEFIRIFAKAGAVMSEDKLHFGAEVKPPLDAAKVLFPNQN